MKCIELRQPGLLITRLREMNELELKDLTNCFFEEYFVFCRKFGASHVFIFNAFPPDKEDELHLDAFIDTQTALFKYLLEHGYEERGFKFDTFVLQFYKRAIWRRVLKESGYNSNIYGGDPAGIIEQDGRQSHDPTAEGDQLGEKERRHRLLGQAMGQLGERCRNLIQWRKLDLLSIEEIAERIGQQHHMVIKEMYKCMLKLKQLMNGSR